MRLYLVSSEGGTSPTDKKFTGQRLDGTGLYYYNARYYDPVIGRFISGDSIVPDPTNPQAFNRYSYCVNNPLKYTDPSGHLEGTVTIGGETYTLVEDGGGNHHLVAPYGGKTGSVGLKELFEMIAGYMTQIGDYNYGGSPDSGPVVRADVQTNLRGRPIPVNYVPEDSKQAKYLNKINAGGISLSPLGIYIRYEKYSSSRLEWVTKHECFHYYEQSREGLSWYGNYIREYAVRLGRGHDHDQAYRGLTDEVQANMSADDSSYIPPTSRQTPWDSFQQLVGYLVEDLITDLAKFSAP